jgi:hypothetical protein
MRCLKLPFHFDPVRLSADLAQVAPGEWIPHINRHDYEGRWSGAALRSVAGDAGNIVPEAPDIDAWRETALLRRCGYFREVLETLACPLQAVRLLSLHTGSKIAEHVDRALDFEDGEVRLHVPIATNDQLFFYLDGARLVMKPGECWYTNVNLPHSVENQGATDRIHLVIDCKVDDWLRKVFVATPRPEPDHYAAELTGLTEPATGAWMEVFSGAAASFSAGTEQVMFRSEGTVLLLSWRGALSWQFRLRLGADGTAQLESSPDLARTHQPAYVELLARIRTAFPVAKIVEQGLR